MSCVWATKIVVFVFLCAHPLPHFALRTWISLVAGNFSEAKLLDIRHQKVSGEGRETERIKHTIGRLLFSNQLKLIERSTLSLPTEEKPLGESSVPHLQNSTRGRQPESITRRKRSLSAFTGHGNPKKAFVSPPVPDAHMAERWLSMKPVVECAGNAMTLTAHGKGYKNLLVDREGSSPVSLFHLPPNCGYNMRYTWKDLILKVPYDACYITKENGSYVLPLLWWGRPVKISCPVIAIPQMLCSFYGVVLKVTGVEDGEQKLKAKVEDKRVPLVSAECAHLVEAPPEELILFAPYSAACVTVKDGQSTIIVVIGGTEFTMACPLPHASPFPHPFDPLHPEFPHTQQHSQLEHLPPKVPTTTTPTTPAPTTPISSSTSPGGSKETLPPPVQLYYNPYMSFLHPFAGQKWPVPPHSQQESQSLNIPTQSSPAPTPPTPTPTPPPTPTPDSKQIPGSPDMGYYNGHLLPHPYLYVGQILPGHHAQQEAPSPPSGKAPGSKQTPDSPVGPYSYLMPHPYPYPYPHMGPVFPTHPHTQQESQPPPASTRIPLSGPAPESSPGSQFPKGVHWPFLPYPHPHMGQPFPGLPVQPQQEFQPPPSSAASTPKPTPEPTPIPTPMPTSGPSLSFHHPDHGNIMPVHSQKEYSPVPPLTQSSSSQSAHQGPMLYYPPYQAPFPVPVCPPNSRLACTGYPHPFPYSGVLTSTTTVAAQSATKGSPTLGPSKVMSPGAATATTALPDAQKTVSSPESPAKAEAPSHLAPSLSCMMDHLVLSLPTALPHSIQFREGKNSWVSVESSPAHCQYEVQPGMKGVLLSSPLPACHSRTLEDPYILSLPVRFWDVMLGRYYYLDLRCPFTHKLHATTATPTTTIDHWTHPPPIPTTTIGHWTHPPKIPTTTIGHWTHPPKIPTTTIGHWTHPPPTPTTTIGHWTHPPKIPTTTIGHWTHPPKIPTTTFGHWTHPTPIPTTTIGHWTHPPPIPTTTIGHWTHPTPIPTTTIGHWTHPTPIPTSSFPRPEVLCSTQHMTVALPHVPVSHLVVKDLEGNEVKVEDAPVHCGYEVKVGKSGHVTIILPFNSCHMTVKGSRYTVELKYRLSDGQQGLAQLSCPVPHPVSGPKCDVPSDQQIACAPGPVDSSHCHFLGCCHCAATGACYYPMDECTGDGHFVFSVPASIMSPPLNPAKLVAGGNASCTPLRATKEYALFKIPLDGCGTHKFEVGQTVIYMLEILNTVQAISLNYGTITRDSPVRVLVECRFLPGSVVSVGYLVKRPSLGPSIQAQGVFGVQLRIAKDHSYSSFHPQYHRPLSVLLGKPLHLEVRLLSSPDPSVVLLVHYCVAYPRSAQSAWVLIYDGCPNPLDPGPHITPTPPPPEVPNQTRRFTISAFQFLPNGDAAGLADSYQSDEEIYFMCSTEVCSPSDGPCVEGCFSDPSNVLD